MRINLLIVAVLAVAICGFCTLGCGKKAKETAKTNPHSADSIMQDLKKQAQQFNDAVQRQDFKYLHDYGYYFIGVIVAFNAKLDAADKQRLQAPIKELLELSNQLDRAGGGNHAEAAAKTVNDIQAKVNELEQLYQQGKHSG
jgi:hypothetical protein